MYSKLMFHKSLHTSCRIATKLRPTNAVSIVSRNFSSINKREKHNLALCYAYKFQNHSSVLNGSLLVRYQSTQNATAVNPETSSANTNVNTGAESAQSVVPDASVQWVNEAGEAIVIPDAPVPIEVVQALSANGEPTFASLGLCNYTPVGLIEKMFELVHVYGNVPWWAAIALCTLGLRLLMFPLLIKTQKTTAEMSEHMPKIQYYTAKMTEARNSGDVYEASLYGNELMQYTKKHKFRPMNSMIAPMIQAPVFLSMFYGLRQLASKVESMKEGGLWWFADLSVYDPYYVLPTLTAVTLFITLEVGSDSVSAKHMAPMVKNGLRALPVIIFPFTMHFEGAVLVYWVTNNFVSLIQVAILKTPKVREYLGIPQNKEAPVFMQKPKIKRGFKKAFNDTIKNFKASREMRERENYNEMQFRRAGKGPLVKTFDTNPKSNQAAVLTKQRSV